MSGCIATSNSVHNLWRPACLLSATFNAGRPLIRYTCPNPALPRPAVFFLCPSRFEPCGLADIEFGWLGSVMIGHNTGGAPACTPDACCADLLSDHDSRCASINAGGKPRAHPIFVQLLLLVASAGGLGKMPGYYYTAELDCAEDQSIR